MQRVEKQDIYTRITNQIVSHLERGVRPWAMDPDLAERLWAKSQEWTGVTFNA